MNKLNVVLLLLALASGMAVITVQDQSREYFIALTNAQKQQTQLNDDFSRLKLEQAKLANHQLIKAAAEKQNLRPPGALDTKMVEVK